MRRSRKILKVGLLRKVRAPLKGYWVTPRKGNLTESVTETKLHLGDVKVQK